MKVGTRSLLFGVHQFLWHPFTVWLAWHKCYGRWPDWITCLCIFFHDWGYWGCPNMDGEEGKKHPYAGAEIVFRLTSILYGMCLTRVTPDEAWDMCCFHSCWMADAWGAWPSKLYLPDKVSVLFEPDFFYLLRARLSGELQEFVDNAPVGFTGKRGSRDWLRWYKNKVKTKLEQHYEQYGNN